MTISKEKAIVLTSYERKSLFRFLALYLGSVFILLAIIGHLFFENNRTAVTSAMKFEMLYQGRMLSSEIIMKAMMMPEDADEFDLVEYLQTLNICRFDVGYFDKNKEAIFTQIEDFDEFEEDFAIRDGSCYSVVQDTSEHMGVRYIVLKENELAKGLQRLRIRIVSYLILSFILMGVVGYFLGKLFLRPVREQIESLDRFISDTTHELNTPISAILMTIQSLKGVEAKKLARLEASAKRLSTTYSSLTYRLEGKVQPSRILDFSDVVKERVEYLKELIDSKRIVLNMELESTEIRMDETSAYRLIDNLLSNAIKYSDIGDSIRVTLKNRQLIVEDTGIGIDEESQEDIFKRYHRANEERGGFGIGLNIVLTICKNYDIKLGLKSKKGEGTTFTLTFPPLK